MPVILHCRRRRYSLRAAAHHEVHSLLRNRPSKRKVADRDVGKELLKGARIDDSARQRMLAEPRRFFEDSDLKITEAAAGLGILLYEPRQLDRAGKSRRTSADEDNIHWNCFGVERF